MEQTGSITHCNEFTSLALIMPWAVSLYLSKSEAFGNPASAMGTAHMDTQAMLGKSHVDQPTLTLKSPPNVYLECFLAPVFRKGCCLLTDSNESPSTTAHRHNIP